jgi:hypothetical protein
VSLLAGVVGALLAAHVAPPLAAARIAPPDVDALVQVRGGLRATDAGTRALSAGVCDMLDAIGARQAWAHAAASAKLSPWTLFERCAGRDASLLVRRAEVGVEWVLALEVPPTEACELLRGMGARMQGSSRFAMPQLGLVGSVIGDWLLVTDRAESPLLRDMLRVASEPGQPSLAAQLPDGAFRESDAAIEVALRHGASGSVRSVWRAFGNESGVHIDALAAGASDPLGEVRAAVPVGEELSALPEDTVACWVQPMPRDPVPAAWSRLVPAWKPDEAVDATLGARMLVAVGPCGWSEGKLTLAVAYELKDAVRGTAAADAMLDRVAGCCAARPERACSQLARRHGAPLEAPRTWDAPAVVQQAFGGLDVLGATELVARTVPLGNGGWRVYASDRWWLDRVAASLEEVHAPASSVAGSASPRRVGHAHGMRLADALRSGIASSAASDGAPQARALMAAMLRHVGEVTWQSEPIAPGLWRAGLDMTPLRPDEAASVQVADRPWPR